MMVKHDLLDKLSQLVTERKSFKEIMADNVVEDHEIIEHANLVQQLIERLETELSQHDFELVSELIAEITVLQVIVAIQQTAR